jgi:hypothetical protein
VVLLPATVTTASVVQASAAALVTARHNGVRTLANGRFPEIVSMVDAMKVYAPGHARVPVRRDKANAHRLDFKPARVVLQIAQAGRHLCPVAEVMFAPKAA